MSVNTHCRGVNGNPYIFNRVNKYVPWHIQSNWYHNVLASACEEPGYSCTSNAHWFTRLWTNAWLCTIWSSAGLDIGPSPLTSLNRRHCRCSWPTLALLCRWCAVMNLRSIRPRRRYAWYHCELHNRYRRMDAVKSSKTESRLNRVHVVFYHTSTSSDRRLWTDQPRHRCDLQLPPSKSMASSWTKTSPCHRTLESSWAPVLLAGENQTYSSVAMNRCRRLVNSLVMSRVDFCNLVLAGQPACRFDQVQSVLEAAARVITGTRKHDHITS